MSRAEFVHARNGKIMIVEKPDCYKKPIQYSEDGCSNCEHGMECYDLWLKYMNQNEKGLWG